MKFTQIPETTFKEIQLNAGMLLSEFNAEDGSFSQSDIYGATTGGTSFTATPTFVDFGDDIDNCPKNTKELKKIDTWEVTLSGTFITVGEELLQKLIGACDKVGNKLVPRTDLKDDDFFDVWWVGDYSDKNTGENAGFIAIKVMNALSTGGFQLQTGDKAKGQFAYTFTGHYGIESQNVVPFEIYIKTGE